MKRHPDLRKFSEDHHQGLVRARRLRRPADGEGTPSEEACAEAGQPLTLNRREGYDHSYYAISTFMEDHIRHHAEALNRA